MDVKKFDQIDGLRFFAIFSVICGHWNWFAHEFIDFAPITSRGVDLFFVISGFLISIGLFRSKDKTQTKGQSLFKFYVRRFLRIFPIYYLTIFVIYIFWHSQMQGSLWWYILYLVNFHCIKIQAWGVAGLFWSLSVEEQFYMVWPFVILFIPNKRLPAVIIFAVFLSLGAKTYWAIINVSFWTPYMHPLGSLDALALGGLLAYLYQFHQELLRKLVHNQFIICLIIFQLIALIAIGYIADGHKIYDIGIRTSFGLFSMWLIGGAIFGFGGILGLILNSRPLQYIGKISYGIYLFHNFVPGILLGLEYPKDDNLRFIIYAVVTVGIASLSWYAFESPILKLKSRFE